MYPDLWAGSVQSFNIQRDFTGSQLLSVTLQQFEVDTGHVRFQLGSYIPMGSTIVVTYSGGYATVPEDLVMASSFKVALLANVMLEPDDRPAQIKDMEAEYLNLVAPYVREQA